MYKLTDEVITQVGKLLQLAIITGTDLVDNLRMIEVAPSELEPGKLSLSPEYRAVADQQIETLMQEVENIKSENQLEED